VSLNHEAPNFAFSCPCHPSRKILGCKPKYLPQHPTHKYPQPMFFPYCERPNFLLIQNNRKNCTSLYFSLYSVRQQIAGHNILDKWWQTFFKFNLLPISSSMQFWLVSFIPKYMKSATFRGLISYLYVMILSFSLLRTQTHTQHFLSVQPPLQCLIICCATCFGCSYTPSSGTTKILLEWALVRNVIKF
jgi:hypothetical protein